MKISSVDDVRKIESNPIESQRLPSNTYAMISNAAQLAPDSPAISYFRSVHDFKSVEYCTYRECLARITQAANAFRSIGIDRGEVVAYMLPCIPQALYSLWGGEAAGIVMPINPMLEAAQVNQLLCAAKVRWLIIIAPKSLPEKAKLKTMLSGLKSLSGLILVAEDDFKLWEIEAVFPELTVLDFDSLLDSAKAGSLEFVQPRGSDVASYFCTGGTTGMPKIATRTHFSEVYDVWAFSHFVEFLDCRSVVFCGLPLFHVNSQLISGLLPLSKGAHIIMGTPQGFRTKGMLDVFWDIVEYFGISLFSAVPTIYTALLDRPVGETDISSLQAVICGAAPMPVEVFKEFQQRVGVRILEGYGLTEAACVSTINPLYATPRIGSIGIRLPYQSVRVAILDEYGCWVRDAEVDEVGALIIEGPNLFSGYLDASHNKDVWVERKGKRYLNTGDLARCDSQEYFWLTGRRKELIIRGGHNIDPKVIEEALHAHPAVALSAAIGRPDPYAGEVPVGYVQLKPGAVTDRQAILSFCETAINERAAVPKKIYIIDSLPLTAVGKIYKPALIMQEIEQVILEEAVRANIKIMSVGVVQRDDGIHAKVSIMDGVDEFKKILGRYTFSFEVYAR